MSEATEMIVGEFDKPNDAIVKKCMEVSPEIRDIINKSILDLSKENPDPEILLECNGQPYSTRGNFSIIIGLPGSRKTFYSTLTIGAYLKGEYGGFDAVNGKGKVLWIDTEQAPGHVARIGRRINRIIDAAENENNPNVTILMLREYDPKVRKQVFNGALEIFHPDFVMLDGAADLMDDPNNIEQSAEIQQLLMSSSKIYNCHIATVVHCNPGNEKARGHLGGNLMRKCETAVIITAQGEVSKVSFAKTRDKRPDDFAFMIQNGLPELCKIPVENSKDENTKEMFAELLSDGKAATHGVLAERVIEYRHRKGKLIKFDRAKQIVTNAAKVGIISKNNANGYTLSVNKEGSDDMLPF